MSDSTVKPASPNEEHVNDHLSTQTASREPSVENGVPADSPPGPARIRKKRSSAPVQPAHQTKDPSRSPNDTPGPLNGSSSGKAVRQGSLRNAVRRLFGKKAKATEKLSHAPPITKAVPRHGHTTSDPGALRSIPEQPHSGTDLPSEGPQRTLSAPFEFVEPVGTRKVRSPYAVEFPQSARLKPLDLANPFHRDGAEPKRRATLHSITLDEMEAAALTRAIHARSEDYTSERFVGLAAEHSDEIGLAVTTPNGKHHRRSRSADDLLRLVHSSQPVRDLGSEVDFWRQSTAGSMMQHDTQDEGNLETSPHGIGQAVSPVGEGNEDPFVVDDDEPFNNDAEVSPMQTETVGRASPMRDSPLMSHFGKDEEPPRTDLESRVLQLEDSVATFQVELERLVTEANQRTQMDNSASTRTSRQNTPSMLITSLADANNRHSTAYRGLDGNYTARGGPSEESQRQRQPPTQPSPARTYAALYSIINQERAARRALEEQLRHLQDSFAEMQYQLSQPIIGRHSSAYQPPHQMHGDYRQTSHYSAVPVAIENDQAEQRLTSRFSLSESLAESEAARLRDSRELEMEDDRGVSFDLYRSPAEDHAQRSQAVAVDGGMF
ncbi:hypothetical protein ANO11243_058340 [Dothideomycetidae sp. 11243]|nr:hypothetical protein ANO11243_058340 [fungal sp. No.11243]